MQGFHDFLDAHDITGERISLVVDDLLEIYLVVYPVRRVLADIA